LRFNVAKADFLPNSKFGAPALLLLSHAMLFSLEVAVSQEQLAARMFVVPQDRIASSHAE